MFPLNVHSLANIVGGRLLRGNAVAPINGALYGRVKELRPGIAFFMQLSERVQEQLTALHNERCTVVVTTRAFVARMPQRCAVIAVGNPYEAFWRLVKWQRARSSAFFIGITGSAGKTTTKEMLASVLIRKYRTLKSYSNMNVFTYVPHHLLRLAPSHRMAVLEMGMGSFGNIRAQCRVVRPQMGIITNVGEAHAGNLGSSLAGVVKAKQEMVDGVVAGGTLLLNADDRGTQKLSTQSFRGTIIRYGIRKPAHVRATDVRYVQSGMAFTVGRTPFFIPSFGRHNVYNALAVIAAARQLGVPDNLIQHGLRHYERPYRRLQQMHGIKQSLLINDTYNANPTAAIQGLRVLNHVANGRPTVAVIGDMLVLGQLSQQGHRRVGKFIAKKKIGTLVTIGKQARQVAVGAQKKGMPAARIYSFETVRQAHNFLKQHMPQRAVLYFKASHATGLNQLVTALRV